MKRTLMLKNQELLDFDIEPVSGKMHILDAPDTGDALLSSIGLDGPDREAIVAGVIRHRRISPNREDVAQILDAFGARSTSELAFMGHGLSLVDKLWYRSSGSDERWEDINFIDNDWDSTFRMSMLTHDYRKLASCSPDVPDVTTGGHLRKAWERNEACVQLLKDSLFQNGSDLEGALLGAKLCCLLYGQDTFQPLNVVERYGRLFAASPLMVGRDEELVQGYRMFAMGGFDASEAAELMGSASPQVYVNAVSRAGVPGAMTHVAKVFAFKSLALLNDMHAGNIGIIRNIETGACRAAPPFDYDRSFGFPGIDFPFEDMCDNPNIAMILCAKEFSDLDSSWDWSWYDPGALEGFELRILDALSTNPELPSNFGKLVANLFVMQRNYVNEVALT